MSTSLPLTFFHNPHSRATMVRALLEELDVDYKLHVVDFRHNEQLTPAYRAINPMGKVPAIRHGDTVVTENVAIYIYLADYFSEAGLAPAFDDTARGSYLRWLVFYAACFEPAIGDRARRIEPAPRMQSGYADFDTMLKTLLDQLAAGPWLLGERFSAADVLWGNALRWATRFELMQATPVVSDYIERVVSRPAQVRADEANLALATEMGLAA
ncbi:MAG TPA: glutathione S-transferase family protein [Oleiagrimonas sp.]|nr:glutathione S-transferase family protein [Oleiagrimonas sp.]